MPLLVDSNFKFTKTGGEAEGVITVCAIGKNDHEELKVYQLAKGAPDGTHFEVRVPKNKALSTLINSKSLLNKLEYKVELTV
jgi:hypothetical protein